VKSTVEWPLSTNPPYGCSWPVSDRRVSRSRPAQTGLNLSLLGDLQRIVHFDSEIPDGALKFAMTEEKLIGAEISGPSVD